MWFSISLSAFQIGWEVPSSVSFVAISMVSTAKPLTKWPWAKWVIREIWNMKNITKKTAVLLAFFPLFLTSLRPWTAASTCLRTLLPRSVVQRIRHMAHSCWLLRPVINSTAAAAAAAFSLLLRSFVCLLKSFSWHWDNGASRHPAKTLWKLAISKL